MPDQVIISAVEPADWDEGRTDPRIQVLFGTKGLTRQRNRAIAALDRKCEIVSMMDDDVELPKDYFERVQGIFTQRPDVAICFANVRNGLGMSRDQARQALAHWSAPDEFREGACGLGCSMNIRRSVFDHVSFDERLPLYGWLEDADFAARSRPYGKVGTYEACRIIHLLEQKMRLSGVRFGFSQVMNPYYLWRKGSIPFNEVLLSHWLKGTCSNAFGLLRPDRTIDRAGRLRGSFLAFSLLIRGCVEPERIERL